MIYYMETQPVQKALNWNFKKMLGEEGGQNLGLSLLIKL
jgi:hypothetical protein